MTESPIFNHKGVAAPLRYFHKLGLVSVRMFSVCPCPCTPSQIWKETSSQIGFSLNKN